MNSVEDLRDYVTVDVINRIESMSREELVRELIELSTTSLEQMDADELLSFKHRTHTMLPFKNYVSRGTGQTT